MKALRLITVAAAVVLVCISAGCGSYRKLKDPGTPKGQPMLPDLSPAPPVDVQMTKLNGKWFIRFSSTLVNVGEGDFVLRAQREDGKWQLEQQVPYSEGGAQLVPVASGLVWGGDRHNHWHVPRVANYHLVPLNAAGPAGRHGGRIDSKVGFCFYDYSKELKRGPEKPAYSRFGCGHMDDNVVAMGLSVGWADTYPFILPGQNIAVTGLADGTYRLWAEADEAKRFREASRDNDLTWVDFKLTTRKGLRFAQVVKVGPKPKAA